MQWWGVVWLLMSSLAVAMDESRPDRDNPLAGPPTTALATGELDAFQGVFANSEVHLVLQYRNGYYVGEVKYQGQAYPLDASIQGGRLHGWFYQQGNGYPFVLHREGEIIHYETGGRAFALRPAAPPLPLPELPPPANAAEALWAAPVSPEELARELTASARHVRESLRRFMETVAGWLDQNLPDGEAARRLEQELIPQALALRTRLQRVQQLAAQGREQLQVAEADAQLLQRYEQVTGKGQKLFNDWHQLLSHLAEYYQNGKQAELQQLASQYLPPATQGSTGFSRQFVQLSARIEKIPALQSATPLNAKIPNPASLLKWQTLNNMSETMREGIEVFKDFHKELDEGR